MLVIFRADMLNITFSDPHIRHIGSKMPSNFVIVKDSRLEQKDLFYSVLF